MDIIYQFGNKNKEDEQSSLVEDHDKILKQIT